MIKDINIFTRIIEKIIIYTWKKDMKVLYRLLDVWYDQFEYMGAKVYIAHSMWEI